MTDAVIVATARTPIGRAFKGSLVDARPDDLGGFIVDTVLNKVPELDRADVEDVIIGAANGSGEQSMNVGRERMDEIAKMSQDRAVAAQENGFFDREITPYTLPDGTVVAKDDGPRAGTSLEKLGSLKPAFREEGRVTAGNACPLNDGAAAVVVMSEDKARALGITPLARIIASSVSGLAREIMGVGPIVAVQKVLARAGMKIDDIDVFELNEAFAAQVIPVCDELGVSIGDQLNPNGGAIALGHPFDMTGARIMTTLINDLQTRDQTYGIETMCVGGGQGMAMIVERLS
jgi:acetyl-CoA C-acetyltransferase